MYVYNCEEFINGHAIANLSSIYTSADGKTYCEGCVVEHYVDPASNKLWLRKSTKKGLKVDRVYRIENGRYHRVSEQDFKLIPDWTHRFLKSKIQSF